MVNDGHLGRYQLLWVHHIDRSLRFLTEQGRFVKSDADIAMISSMASPMLDGNW
jgi:hypothetical protein